MARSRNVSLSMIGIGRPVPDQPITINTQVAEGPQVFLGRRMALPLTNSEAIWLVEQVTYRLAGLDKIENIVDRRMQERVIGEAIKAVIDGFRDVSEETKS